ncbi:lumenal Hsp70 protein, partial [Spiromyces aspiralis]
MLRHTLALVAASVLAAVVGIASVNGALLGIDYGTEWFKVALVQPGRPLDLVLNRDSKRKSPSVVLVDGLERTFGSEAVGM